MATSTRLVAIVEYDHEDTFETEEENHPSEPPYIYTPLPSKGDHLRLIELFPDDFEEPLHISISTYTLDSTIDKPPYYAVSYTWNDSEYDRLIVQGKRIPHTDGFRTKYAVRHPLWVGEARILVTTNLRDALRRFRDPDKSITLWIDFLCINQADLDERAAQVMTMQRIYHSAGKVFLWLGEEGNHSTRAVNLLKRLQKISVDTRAGRIEPPSRKDLYDPQVWMELNLPPFPHNTAWAGIMSIFARPVFHRIWIVQELVAARKAEVYCGSSPPFEYRVFEHALGFLQRTGWIYTMDTLLAGGQNKISSFIAVAAIRSIWMQHPTVELRKEQRRNLVERTRRFEATDPRDKVFALLPLINDYGHRDLHGVDAPAEMRSSLSPQKREGPIDRLLKSMVLEEEHDEAMEVLRGSTDPVFADVRRGLEQFLCYAPQVLAPFLAPASYSADSCRMLGRVLEDERKIAIRPIVEFVSDHRPRSTENREVLAYIDRFYQKVISRIETFSNLLRSPSMELMLELTKDRDYITDIKELEESITKTLQKLRKKPSDTEGAQKESIKNLFAKGKIIMGPTVGSSSLSNEMESMNLDHQFHDWAWSPTGSAIPDYRKDIADIYTQFTVKCLQDDKCLDVLSAVEDPSLRKQRGLPSWVPDYSVIPERSTIYSTRKGRDSLFAASGTEEADMEWSIDEPALLQVGGHEFDKIKTLSSLEGALEKNITTQPEEWAAMIEELPEQYVAGGLISDTLWRTLVGDEVISPEGKTISPAPMDYGMYYNMALQVVKLKKVSVGSHEQFVRMLEDDEEMTLEQYRRWTENHDLFMEAMAPTMLQRRLCVTERGYLAAVPSSARVGDAVFVLKGGPVPYVLRNTGSREENLYELIGECYLHGVMKGEQKGKYTFGQITLV